MSWFQTLRDSLAWSSSTIVLRVLHQALCQPQRWLKERKDQVATYCLARQATTSLAAMRKMMEDRGIATQIDTNNISHIEVAGGVQVFGRFALPHDDDAIPDRLLKDHVEFCATKLQSDEDTTKGEPLIHGRLCVASCLWYRQDKV